jgi:hypothetical protein
VPKLSVLFRNSGFAGRRLELEQPVLRLGRDPTCEILFDERADRVVSRVHAEIRWGTDGRPWLHPNGERLVFREGVRVPAPTSLRPGDLIEFAGVGGPSIEIRYAAPDLHEAPTPPAVPVLPDGLAAGGTTDAPPEPPSTGARGLLDQPTSVRPIPFLEPTTSPSLARVGAGPLEPRPPAAAVSASQQQTMVLSLAELQSVAAAAVRSDPAVITVGTPAPPRAPHAAREQDRPAARQPRLSEIATDPGIVMAKDVEVAATVAATAPRLPLVEQRTDSLSLPGRENPAGEPRATADETATELALRVVLPPQALPAPLRSEGLTAPARPSAPPTPATATPLPRPPPDDFDAKSTMMIPANAVPGASPEGSTQFLRIDQLPAPDEEATPRPPPSRRPIYVTLGAAALLLLLAAMGYLGWRNSERSRIAQARIERMRAALVVLEKAGREGDSEYLQIQQELEHETQKGQAAPTSAPVLPRKEVAAGPAPAKTERDRPEAEPGASPDDTAEAARLERERELTRLRTEARSAFAAVKAKELELLGVPKSARATFAAERLALYQAYVTARASLALSMDGIEPLIRRTASWLGECDALVPPRFAAEVKEAVARLKAPGVERDLFVEAVKRGTELRYAQTITAALADNGLPVELYFLAWWASSLDPRLVGAEEPRGVPRGMWQLLPAPAERMGLRKGSLAATAEYDGTDERHLFEKETKAVARLLRDAYRRQTAGSALLLAASWDHGDTEALAAMKRKAGLAPDDTDPARTSFWALYEANAVGEERRKAAAEIFAAVLVAAEPKQFGLAFDLPIRHVDAVETK